MNTAIVGVHAVCVLAAYVLFGLSYIVVPRGTWVTTERTMLPYIVLAFAGSASVSGFALMLASPRGRESVALAVSTVAAVLLFILVL